MSVLDLQAASMSPPLDVGDIVTAFDGVSYICLQATDELCTLAPFDGTKVNSIPSLQIAMMLEGGDLVVTSAASNVAADRPAMGRSDARRTAYVTAFYRMQGTGVLGLSGDLLGRAIRMIHADEQIAAYEAFGRTGELDDLTVPPPPSSTELRSWLERERRT